MRRGRASSRTSRGTCSRADAGADVRIARAIWNNGGRSDACGLGADDAAIRVINPIVDAPCPLALDALSTNVTNLDPELVSGADYRLGNGSPARDVGVPFPIGGIVTVDFDGRSRTLGPNPDLGPLENTGLFANGFE